MDNLGQAICVRNREQSVATPCTTKLSGQPLKFRQGTKFLVPWNNLSLGTSVSLVIDYWLVLIDMEFNDTQNAIPFQSPIIRMFC